LKTILKAKKSICSKSHKNFSNSENSRLILSVTSAVPCQLLEICKQTLLNCKWKDKDNRNLSIMQTSLFKLWKEKLQELKAKEVRKKKQNFFKTLRNATKSWNW